MYYIILLALLWCTTAHAIEQQVTVDTSVLTREQQKLVKPAMFRILGENNAGECSITGTSGSYVVKTQDFFNMDLLNTANVLAQVGEIEVERANTAATKATLLTEFNTLGSEITTSYGTWDTLTTAQKLAVMKKVLRREVIRQRQET